MKQHLALEASLQRLQGSCFFISLLLLRLLAYLRISCLFFVADENNTALCEIDALKKSLGRVEKKAEDAIGAKERLEQELADAAAAMERLQQETTDREEQLATAAASCEKEVAGKLMAAAKAISGE